MDATYRNPETSSQQSDNQGSPGPIKVFADTKRPDSRLNAQHNFGEFNQTINATHAKRATKTATTTGEATAFST